MSTITRRSVFKRKNILVSKNAFKQEFKALESSKFAQTLGEDVSLTDHVKNPSHFIIDPIYYAKLVPQQLREINGSVLADSDYNFHTPHYKSLLEQIIPLRTEFRLTKDILARKEIAKTEYDAWRAYQD